MRQLSTRATFAVLAFALALTGACKKKDATPPADTSTRTEAVRVSEVDLGRAIGADKRVTAGSESFTVRDTIYASVMTEGTGPATLGARWTFEDGQVVDQSTQSIAPTGPTVTEFHIMKPTAWPAGKYKVEIMLNGQAVESEDFEVK